MKKNVHVIAWDFDETIGLYKYDVHNKNIGYLTKHVANVPNPLIVKLMRKFRKEGIKIIIYSTRWWGDYNTLIDWLRKYHIVVDDIILGRFKADCYVCDKSLNAHEENLEQKIRNMLNDDESWGKWYKQYYGDKK
jgi:hypothetical protein